MKKKILVAYGTAAGSTGEVAQAVGEELESGGAEVTVAPVETVKDISTYDAVILGSAVRAFRILTKTRRFLRQHKRALGTIPVAYFLVCLTMAEETPENIQKAKNFAKPMLRTAEPVSLGLFGGCIDHDKLTGLIAQPIKSIPEQDNRDWVKIRSWAKNTLPKLFEDS